MDALTHGIEAMLSRNATPLTDKDAVWAVGVITRYLPRAYDNGADEEARTMMAYAEYTAGMAFSNAGLGMVHAMAHALGGHYNLAHGVCNAVLLPHVLRFDLAHPEAAAKMQRVALAMGLQNPSPQAVVEAVTEMNARLGIAASLSQLKGVDPKDFSELADLAMRDSCMTTNPVPVTHAQVVETYRKAYAG